MGIMGHNYEPLSFAYNPSRDLQLNSGPLSLIPCPFIELVAQTSSFSCWLSIPLWGVVAYVPLEDLHVAAPDILCLFHIPSQVMSIAHSCSPYHLCGLPGPQEVCIISLLQGGMYWSFILPSLSLRPPWAQKEGERMKYSWRMIVGGPFTVVCLLIYLIWCLQLFRCLYVLS